MPEPVAEEPLLADIRRMLEAGGAGDANVQAVLERLLDHFGCVVGTIHSLDPSAGFLNLRARRGVPDGILDRVRSIPVGKGMAGLAAERCEPVQVCNLQSDDSGVAKPAARRTGMEGSIAVPMLVGGELRGTLGVAKPTEYEYSQDEIDLLLKAAAMIGQHLDDSNT